MLAGDLVHRRFRVGIVVLGALIALGIGIFMVGRRANIFTRKVEYTIRFASAAGLVTGNSVRLSGVTIGSVTDVHLSETPGDSTVTVLISVDRRMTPRIRSNTTASIKTIGLLGDKYVELNGGTASAPKILPGGQIPAAPEAGIEKLLAGGEGLLGDLTAIARSLKMILGRTEKGQGLLGELTSDSPESRSVGSNLNRNLRDLDTLLQSVNSGKGLVGRLLADEKYGRETTESLHAALGSASRLLGKISNDLDRKDGALSALLSDPESKRKVYAMIDRVSEAAISIGRASQSLEKGDGALPMLLHDEAFGRRLRERLDNFTEHLDSVGKKLDDGKGSAARLINDPALFEAVDDILVGVNDSKLLRWLIRDRQKSGIRHRYKDQHGKAPAAGEPEQP